MNSPNSQLGVIPLQKAIDFYFELALYLLVLTGFATLASTGGLDLPSLLLTGMALAVRGLLLARRRPVVISERWTTPLSIVYFVFFAADYFAFSHSFLLSTVHLALFGVVVRMFSVRRERDYLTLAILAFLMVLAAAVLTVDSVFMFGFAVFMLMAVATFVLMEMRRTGHAADISARHTSDPHEHRHLAFTLLRVLPALMLMILLGGTAIFFMLPRLSAGYLGGYTYGTDLSTGFSDHVQLGQIGQIQQSNAVVMHIQIDGDSMGRYDLYWRGVALANFNGYGWSNPRGEFVIQRDMENGFAIPWRQNTQFELRPEIGTRREKLIHYRVLLEPIGTNVFFLAPWARRVHGDYRLLAGDPGGAVYDFDAQHAVSRYEAESDIASPTAAELRTAVPNHASPVMADYLRLPPLDPRVPKLAAQLTEKATNDYDKAAAIETYLRTRFGYTLQLPKSEVRDPIANFLFVRKQGHCEYFASAMAVMLRTVGIPSRVVNGFRTDEFNDLTANYVVRAKDAHSWVEAFFPGYGWYTFDPTPAGGAGVPQGWGRLGLYLDAMSSFWRDWIVSYDTSHQIMLGQAAISSSRGMWEGSREWARKHYESMLQWARQTQGRVRNSPARWLVLGIVIAIAFLLLANLNRIVRWIQEWWVQSRPESAPQQVASIWYTRMARTLAKKGLQKPPAETAQQFVSRITDERLRKPVAQFTDTYEAARFGNSAADARKLPELYEEVELATKNR